MTEDFYASYLEKKFRKKLDIVNIVILIVISLIISLLSIFVTPLWYMISIPIFFIYALFIFKRLKYHLYIKPINRILTQNMDASLFKSISEHSPEYNPISMWAITAALGEGDYQRAVNICNYQLRNTKDEKTKEFALRFLLQIYFELQDVEKLRAVKTKYDELFQNNTNKPNNFVNFIEKFIDEDFENSRKYLGASISLSPNLVYTKAKCNFYLGLLDYKRGDFEAARANFTYICEKAPKLFYATYAKAYIDAIDNGVDYNHAEEIGEILPQENFADSLKFIYPSKKKVIFQRIKTIVSCVLAIVFFLGVNIHYYFISDLCCYQTVPTIIEALFECTNEEFFDKDLEIYDEIGDLRKCAKTNANGTIYFTFSRYQAYRLKNSEWLNAFRDSEKPDCVEISDDLKNVTVHVTPEMKEYSVNDWENFEDEMDRMLFKLYLYVFLDNTDFKNFKIIYTEVDSITGELINKLELQWEYTVIYDNVYYKYHPYG